MEGGNHGIQVKIKVMRKVRGCCGSGIRGWVAGEGEKQVGSLFQPNFTPYNSVYIYLKVFSLSCQSKSCLLQVSSGSSMEL